LSFFFYPYLFLTIPIAALQTICYIILYLIFIAIL
jgi:hypothetical protein